MMFMYNVQCIAAIASFKGSATVMFLHDVKVWGVETGNEAKRLCSI